jgi:hypothetical protein
MAVFEDANVAANLARVEAGGAVRVTSGIIGDRYSQGAVTGAMAAALAANAAVYAMRLNPGATKKVRIHRVCLQWTTIVAFTAPITAGRRLAIFRAVGAAAAGGTALGVTSERDSLSPPSQCDIAQGGDQRIASTGALTVTGVTFEVSPFKVISLSHVGAAGAFFEQVIEFDDDSGGPLILNPGELMVVRNGTAAMDAAGTWQLAVNVDWTEIDDLA